MPLTNAGVADVVKVAQVSLVEVLIASELLTMWIGGIHGIDRRVHFGVNARAGRRRPDLARHRVGCVGLTRQQHLNCVATRLMSWKNAVSPAGISLLDRSCARMPFIPRIGPVVGEVQPSGSLNVGDASKLKPESGSVQVTQEAEPAGR